MVMLNNAKKGATKKPKNKKKGFPKGTALKRKSQSEPGIEPRIKPSTPGF